MDGLETLENMENIIKILKSNNEIIVELKQLSESIKKSDPGRTISSVIGYIEGVHEICSKIEQLEQV